MIDTFKNKALSTNSLFFQRLNLETIQVNLGNICNLQCVHCHVNASPKGNNIMQKEVIDDILKFVSKTKGLVLDITGGCPELNPHFKYFIEKTKPYVNQIKQIIARSNLTVLFEPDMEYLPEFYKKHNIKLICSMPGYTKENVEKQRGKGVFDKSIKALTTLNNIGYGKQENLELDLVYNPGGAFLPADQSDLEKDYKDELKKHGVVFDHLITITNAPINRFEQYLKANGTINEYMKLLVASFNKDVLPNIMCRSLISIGWNGKLYDCDFNQALQLPLRDKNNNIMMVEKLQLQDLNNKEIIFGNHCYCCTAGAGSSCQGVLNKCGS